MQGWAFWGQVERKKEGRVYNQKDEDLRGSSVPARGDAGSGKSANSTAYSEAKLATFRSTAESSTNIETLDTTLLKLRDHPKTLIRQGDARYHAFLQSIGPESQMTMRSTIRDHPKTPPR